MKIDKEKLAAFAAMPDSELWEQIKSIAASHGFKLPNTPPPRSELQKIRSALGADKINLTEALRVLNNYRKGK